MRSYRPPGMAGPAMPVSRTRRPAARIVVRRRPGRNGEGLFAFAGEVVPCALGRGGVVHSKREGDGGTPAARMRLVAAYFRADRRHRPATALPLRAIRPDDGWCDGPSPALYNRPVRLPFAASHERMARGDGLYDIVVVLDFNLSRRRALGGSAIFLHCARPGLEPTEGCVALPAARLSRLLARLPTRATLVVR
jgi:L,D-peptidoglycan transpeptidase YkuD (ErfK/YbiS/YcfS/YnhG family)